MQYSKDATRYSEKIPTPKRLRKQSDGTKQRPKTVAAWPNELETNNTQRVMTNTSKPRLKKQSHIPEIINLHE